MIKYIIPITILFIEIVGIVDAIWPQNNNVRSFFSLWSYDKCYCFALFAIITSVYFIFLYKKDEKSINNS